MFHYANEYLVSKIKACALLLICLLGACQTTPNVSENLYQELGGKSALNKTTYELVARLHRDPKLAELFVDVDDVELKRNIEDFLCQVSDGGCDYQGASMIDSHSELNISKAEFDHFVTIFIRSMTAANIAFRAQNKLLARLAKLRPEVIEL